MRASRKKSLFYWSLLAITFMAVGTYLLYSHAKYPTTSNQTGSLCFEEADSNLPSQTTYCLSTLLETTYKTEGVAGAFAEITNLRQNYPADEFSCHDLMHYIGAWFYDDHDTFIDTLDSQDTDQCWYGFQHGFVSKMIERDGIDIEVLRGYCNKFSSGISQRSCQHGIGHGLFDSYGNAKMIYESPPFKTVLTVCEDVYETEQARQYCLDGIVNSYIIYNLEDDSSFDATVHQRCGHLEDEYQYFCHRNLMYKYSEFADINVSGALSFIQNVAEPTLFGALLNLYTAHTIQWRVEATETSISPVVSGCFSIESEDIKKSCLQGVLLGLALKESADSLQASSDTRNLFEAVCTDVSNSSETICSDILAMPVESLVLR